MPASLRGDLTKWCQEIQTGVYVGNVNARIREKLWERINDNIGQGEATLVYNYNNELGYTFRTTRKDRRVIDADGIPLMQSLIQQPTKRRHFSNAYHYYQAKKHNHSRINKKRNFVVLDLETTGLNPLNDQIISVGAVKNENGKIKSFYQLVKLSEAREKIPSKIKKLTGLSEHLLELKGRSQSEVLTDLFQFTGNLPILGYNLAFDERFIRIALMNNKLELVDNETKDILPIIKSSDKFLDNYHLETVLKRYGIVNSNPHNSLSDAQATFELALKLIENQQLVI